MSARADQESPGSGAGGGEAFYAAVAGRVSDLVCLHDPDGRFRRVPARAWEILGYTADELTRLYPGTLVHPDDRSAARAWSATLGAREGRETVTPAYRILTRSGAPRTVTTRLVPFQGAGGALESLVSITWFSGAETHPEEDELHWREYLYALDQHAMVTISDADDRILYANERFCQTTGWDRADLIGGTHALFSAGVFSDAYFRQLEETVLRGDVWQGEMATRTADDGRLWNWMTVVPLRRGDRPDRYIAIRTDLTEFKNSKRQLEIIREALDATPVGVTVADARAEDLPLTYVNNALCRMTGYSRDEMLGKNCRFLQMGDTEQDGVYEIRRAVREERHATADLRNYRRDGTFFWNQFMLAPVRDATGTTTHFIGVQSDVTEHRQLVDRLAASERRMRLMTSRVRGAVFHMRSCPDGRWELPFMSQGFERLSGVSADDAMADFAVVLEALHPDDRGRIIRAVQEAERQAMPFREEARMQPLDSGEVRWCFLEATPERDEEGALSWYGQMVDITEQKRAQTELEQARRAAEQASRVKSQFLANMSHELRTPLNAIVGMAELLQDTRLDDEQRRYLDVFRTASSNLLEIINNLLDLSKIEAGHLPLEPQDFDLEDLIERQLELLATRAREKGLDLILRYQPGVPRYVHGDPARLRQILTNLVGNAIKFTERGGVTLHVQASPDDAERLTFTVRDTGIGIPADKRDEIFEAFAQADSGITRQYGGTGLGLTICRQLVRLMSGDVDAESPPEGGTAFHFHLPLLRDVQAPSCPVPSLRPGLAGWSVRVVDDFSENHRAVRDALEGRIAVESARNLDEAIAHAGSEEADDAGGAEPAVDGPACVLTLVDAHLPHLHSSRGRKWLAAQRARGRVVLVCNDTRAAERLERDGLAHQCLLRPLRRRSLWDQLERAAHPEPTRAADATAAAEAEAEALPPGDRGEGPSGGPFRGAWPRKEESAPELSVLVAEDDATNALLVRTLLQQAACRVEVVENGQDVIERAREMQPDLILMDLQMPRVDGEEATRRIRTEEREEGRHRVPIVALSAHALEEYRQRSFEAGCDEYLTKPLNRRALHALLERIRQGRGVA